MCIVCINMYDCCLQGPPGDFGPKGIRGPKGPQGAMVKNPVIDIMLTICA